jgi:hypothetical protein
MKEALKTALEAIERILESTIPYTELGTPTLADSAVKLATDALHYGKEALAQPAQKPVAWIAEFENGEQELHFEKPTVGETITPLYTTPPAQEPVTLPHRSGNWCTDLTCKKCYSAEFRFKHTTPQQRQWVELTDEEVQLYAVKHRRLVNAPAFYKAIEAALKEKNHD